MQNKQSLPTEISINEFDSLIATKDFKGIFIRLSPLDEVSLKNKTLTIEGICGLFIPAGAAMAIWQQFPQSVIIHVKDLKTGSMFKSRFEELSISWEGNSDFGPSDQIVQKNFEIEVFEIINSLSQKLDKISELEIYAEFENMKSNTITVFVD